MDQRLFFFNGWGDGNKNVREVTSENSLLHKGNENTGENCQNQLF